MKKIIIAFLGLMLVTFTLKTVAQTPPVDKTQKCEAEALFGSTCKVTCAEGFKPNCHAGLFKARCECIKLEAYLVHPSEFQITPITKSDIEGLSVELTESQQKNFDQLQNFIKGFNEKVAEEIRNKYTEIAKDNDIDTYLANANAIINDLIEMNEEERSKLVEFFKTTYGVEVSFKE